MIDIAAQQEAQRDGPGQCKGQDGHHARRAVVAAGNGGRGRQRQADGGDLGEIVARKVDAEQAKSPERKPMHGAVEYIVVFALVRFLPGRWRWQVVVFLEVSHAEYADENHRNRDNQVTRIAVLPPDKADQEGLRENADRKRHPVAKQSFHERDIDVDRNLVFSF